VEGGTSTSAYAPQSITNPSIQNEGLTGGKYDLSHLVEPKTTGNTEMDTQIANRQAYDKLRKKQQNPEWYESFDNPKHNNIAINIQKNIDNNVNEYNQTQQALQTNKKTQQDLIEQSKNPNLTPEQHNQIKDEFDKIERANIYTDATEKQLKVQQLKLQKDKVDILQAKSNVEDIAYNNEYHPMDSGYNFLANAWNSFIPNAIAGVGSLIQVAGDYGIPSTGGAIVSTASKAAEELTKHFGDENQKQQVLKTVNDYENQSKIVTDLIGNALREVGKSIEASTEDNHPEQHQIAGMMGGLIGNVAQIALGTEGLSLAEKGAKVLTAASFGTSAANSAFNEATNAGLKGTDRDNFVLANTAVNAALVALPAGKIIDKAFSNTLVKDILAESLDKIKEKGLSGQAIFDEVNKTFKEKGIILAKHVATNAIKSTAEGAAFGTATGTAEFGIKKIANAALGEDKFEANPNDIWESTKMMALGGGLMGTAAGGTGLKGIDKSFYNKVVSLNNPHDFKQFNELLDAKVKSGEIKPEEAQNITNNIAAIHEANNKIPPIVKNTEKRIEAINLISEKNRLMQDNATLIEEAGKYEPSMVKDYPKQIDKNNARINNINSDLTLISKGSEREQLLTKNLKQNAIQKPSTERNVPLPGATGETITEGGEGVRQGIKGDETTKEGKENVIAQTEDLEELDFLKLKDDNGTVTELEKNRITELEQKINPTEAVSEQIKPQIKDGKPKITKSKEVGKTKESVSAKEVSAEPIKIKTKRRGNRTPKSERKLGEHLKSALKVEAATPYDDVLHYFIEGGQLHPSAIKEFFGGGGKKTQGESAAKLQILNSKTGRTIDGIAHHLYEKGSKEYDTRQYKEAVEKVLLEHNTPKEMANYLLNRGLGDLSKNDRAYREANFGFSEEEIAAQEQLKEHEKQFIDDARDIYDELSTEEIEQLAKDADESQIDEFVKQFGEETQIGKKDLILDVADKKAKMQSAENKYQKAKAELEKKGQEDQINIFGETPREAKLFKEDLSASKKVVENYKNEYLDVKKEYEKSQKNLDNYVEPNQLSISEQAKVIADNIRKGKIDGTMTAPPLLKQAWNGGLELAAKAIEAGGTVTEAIAKAIEHFKNSDYYKSLSESGKKRLIEHLEETLDAKKSKEHKLFDRIDELSKEPLLSNKDRAEIQKIYYENPKVKEINRNFKKIISQLEGTEEFKKSDGCP